MRTFRRSSTGVCYLFMFLVRSWHFSNIISSMKLIVFTSWLKGHPFKGVLRSISSKLSRPHVNNFIAKHQRRSPLCSMVKHLDYTQRLLLPRQKASKLAQSARAQDVFDSKCTWKVKIGVSNFVSPGYPNAWN